MMSAKFQSRLSIRIRFVHDMGDLLPSQARPTPGVGSTFWDLDPLATTIRAHAFVIVFNRPARSVRREILASETGFWGQKFCKESGGKE